MIEENPEYIYFKERIEESKKIDKLSLYDVDQMFISYKNTAVQVKKMLNSSIDSDRKILRIVESKDAEPILKHYNNLVKKRDNINEFIIWAEYKNKHNLIHFLPKYGE